MGLSSLQAVIRGLRRPARALGGLAHRLAVCALLGCPQQLTDDFSIERPDATPPPSEVDQSDRADATPPPSEVDCAPFDDCSGTCVDLQSNASHCGACGAAVEAEQICSQGNPISAESGCGTRRLCDRGCVDVQAHLLHCGACGVQCDRGARCMMGRCECPLGMRDCGSTCSQCCSSSDCPMERQCSAGVCLLMCEPPNVVCMDRCVDVQSDPMHCGGCGNACGPMGRCVNAACMRP